MTSKVTGTTTGQSSSSSGLAHAKIGSHTALKKHCGRMSLPLPVVHILRTMAAQSPARISTCRDHLLLVDRVRFGKHGTPTSNSLRSSILRQFPKLSDGDPKPSRLLVKNDQSQRHILYLSQICDTPSRSMIFESVHLFRSPSVHRVGNE